MVYYILHKMVHKKRSGRRSLCGASRGWAAQFRSPGSTRGRTAS